MKYTDGGIYPIFIKKIKLMECNFIQ